MKKVLSWGDKPQNAQNLKVLRDLLGLSQSQMASALGGIPQGSYKMWEFNTRAPSKVREALYEAGLNLNWLDSGSGPMLRPGIARIQVARDEVSGKPIGLRAVSDKTPVNIGDSNAQGISPDNVSSAWLLVHEACAAAGARPDLMPAKGLGRLLAIVAEKISRGEAAEMRGALLDEAKDLVGSMVQGKGR